MGDRQEDEGRFPTWGEKAHSIMYCKKVKAKVMPHELPDTLPL